MRRQLGLAYAGGLGAASVVMHAKFMHELCSLLMHIPTY
jgi:hypothetical protein